jgi:hypothetical protein
MPCYTRRETTVVIEAADKDILKAGLEAAGFDRVEQSAGGLRARHKQSGEQITIRDGRLTVQTESLINEVKRAYSHEVVRRTAKKFGWKLTETKEQNQYRAARRR